MKLIDQYIIKKFLTAFFFIVLLIVLIICVIDITENLDEFLEKNISLDKVLLEYYLNYIPYLANMLSPLIVFIATVFVTARMASHTEIIAILSSGVSFKRLLLPYIIGATLISIITFVLIGWIIPHSNLIRIEFQNTYLEDNKGNHGSNVHMKISSDTYVYMSNYNPDANSGNKFTLEVVGDSGLTYKLKAAKIRWDSTHRRWGLDRYVIRTFNGEKETYEFGLHKDTVIALSPSDLLQNQMLYSTFTLGELESYIDKLEERGAENIEVYLIEKYERYTYPFAIIILTVMGVIASSRKSREGPGFQIALGFVLAFVYIIMVIMSRNTASGGDIHPLLAVWIPNILFTGIGAYMYTKVPK